MAIESFSRGLVEEEWRRLKYFVCSNKADETVRRVLLDKLRTKKLNVFLCLH